ncbi:MAG: hypothetical protein ACOCXJ_04120 [Planctomycetota bacterium]
MRLPVWVTFLALPILRLGAVIGLRWHGPPQAREYAGLQFLRNDLFLARERYRAGGHSDADGDGRGAYGGLGALAEWGLIDAAHAGPDPVAGYRYRIYLLDGQGGAVDADSDAPVFCPTHTGMLHWSADVERPPAADAAFTGLDAAFTELDAAALPHSQWQDLRTLPPP